MKWFLSVLAAVFLSGCFADDAPNPQQQIQLGKATFIQNCQVCHGRSAQGLTKNWKKRGADGTFPAPPLDGSAHTWHHSPQILLKTINQGGKQLGGTMPGFKTVLNEAQKQSLLAYLYSLWPLDIQQKYRQHFKPASY